MRRQLLFMHINASEFQTSGIYRSVAISLSITRTRTGQDWAYNALYFIVSFFSYFNCNQWQVHHWSKVLRPFKYLIPKTPIFLEKDTYSKRTMFLIRSIFFKMCSHKSIVFFNSNLFAVLNVPNVNWRILRSNSKIIVLSDKSIYYSRILWQFLVFFCQEDLQFNSS